jgi:hypothetical protein
MLDRSIAHVIRPDFGETRLDALQRHAFRYFLNETNAANGLVADRTQPGAPASIAAIGFALAAYPVVLMCENYRTGLLWELMRTCPYVVTGLRRAGFTIGGYNGGR